MADIMRGALRMMKKDDLERKLYECRKRRDEHVAGEAELAACFGKEPPKQPDWTTVTYNMEIVRIRKELVRLLYPL